MSCSGWKSVTPGVLINYDLEAHPLQIKTDSTEGSKERVYVTLISAVGSVSFQVLFTNPPQYHIGYCVYAFPVFPVTFPVEQDKIWTFTKTDTALIIDCNGVEVLNYVFSGSGLPNCASTMSLDVERIKLHKDASDAYRQQPGKY